MRIQVPLVVDMTDEQVRKYAAQYGLADAAGQLRARDVVADVQSYVLALVKDSPAFGEAGNGDGARAAEVSIKR